MARGRKAHSGTALLMALGMLAAAAVSAVQRQLDQHRADQHRADQHKNSPVAIDPCVGSRLLSVVAHADDDLYFLNPAIDSAIARGACVQTVVVTAGYTDSADNTARQAGLQAAYAAMAGRPEAVWQEHWLTVAGHAVQQLTLTGTPRIVLSFLHLPCGAHDSIAPRYPPSLYQLYVEALPTETIGSHPGSRYDRQQLQAVLRALVVEWDPDTLLTLQPHRAFPVRHSRPGGEGAHPDHVIVARLVLAAIADLPRVRTVRLHDDYPIQDFPANLSPAEAERKTDILQAYCREDRRGCVDAERLVPACGTDPAVGWGEAWLCRHYPQRVPNRQ